MENLASIDTAMEFLQGVVASIESDGKLRDLRLGLDSHDPETWVEGDGVQVEDELLLEKFYF